MTESDFSEELPEEGEEGLAEMFFDNSDLVDDDEAALELVAENLDRFMGVATVEAVFGEPVQQGDALIIPVAEVGSMMGFGLGNGYGGDQTNTGAGSGGGGGGWNFSRPVAVIVATPGGVQVQPVVDVTKVALAAFTTAGFIVGMMARMLRGPRPRR
jgi:uncharacterized spore protein YtfJ